MKFIMQQERRAGVTPAILPVSALYKTTEIYLSGRRSATTEEAVAFR